MGRMTFVALLLGLSAWAILVQAEDPYINLDWNVSYGTISPLGVPQQGILINGQFPGPRVNCTSNNNMHINIFNNLDEPLLFHWNGIQQRKDSWEDGTPGTMCPIMPGTNYTYEFQVKDQVGSFFYFPSTGLLRASGGFGALNVHSRELIPVPFDNPADEFNVLTGDWYKKKKGHKSLVKKLNNGTSIHRPKGIHINGKSAKVGDNAEPMFTMESGKTYRYRFCNVGLRTSLNVRIQGHPMKLVELEGSHTIQNTYDSLDIHVGQCLSVLVTADQEPNDYFLVVSSRFMKHMMETVSVIRYANGKAQASTELPAPPPDNTAGIAWSMNQFRSFRWNLTASAARPNPQGSYKYGKINITRTIRLANGKYRVDGKLRFSVNGISHIDTPTPLKLTEYFGVADKEFNYNQMADEPPKCPGIKILPNVINGTYRNFIEVIFENPEKRIQTWHLDGYSFFGVAMEPGKWTPEKRNNYNLVDAVSRHNIQVYPKSWAAVLMTLDNAGMWNWRSDMWERVYLGQQFYVSVLSPERSVRDEYNIHEKQLLCGAVLGLPKPPPYKSDD